MEITYLQQPKNSRQCGQHCLSMLTGKNIEEVIELVGTKRGTSTRDIIKALKELGIENSERLVSRRTQPMPKIAICKVRREWNKSGGWHWVLLYNGDIYDPDPREEKGMDKVTPLEQYDRIIAKLNQKISSYITIMNDFERR